MNFMRRTPFIMMAPIFSHPLWKKSTSQQCLHCCEIYSDMHFCKALTRKCYSCRHYGHISSSPLCPNNKTSTKLNSEKPASKNISTSEIPQQDPAAVCKLLPFCSITNDELVNCVPSLSHQDNLISQLQQRNNHQQTVIASLQESETNLQKELRETQNKNQVHLSALSEATNTIETLNNNIQTLLNFVSDFDKFWFDSSMENKQIRDEQCEIIDYLCDANQNRSRLNLNPKFKCNRCGLFVKHSLKECPAEDNNCARCLKDNHFTFMCKKPEDIPQLTFTQETETLFREIHQKNPRWHQRYADLYFLTVKEQDSAGVYCISNK